MYRVIRRSYWGGNTRWLLRVFVRVLRCATLLVGKFGSGGVFLLPLDGKVNSALRCSFCFYSALSSLFGSSFFLLPLCSKINRSLRRGFGLALSSLVGCSFFDLAPFGRGLRGSCFFT
jgi:hypothetical protein